MWCAKHKNRKLPGSTASADRVELLTDSESEPCSVKSSAVSGRSRSYCSSIWYMIETQCVACRVCLSRVRFDTDAYGDDEWT